MLRRIRPTLPFLLLLLFLAALPAGGQGGATAPAGTRIIVVEVEVSDLETGETDVHPLGEHVPLTVGDRVHVRLRVTGMVSGAGRRIDVPVEYEVGGGNWRIEVQPARNGDGIVVEALRPDEDDRGRPDSRSHVDFRILGDYDVKPRLASGSITFDIDPAAVAADDDRREAAEAVARDLAHILYVDDPAVDTVWVDRLDAGGYSAATALARQLAAQAQRSAGLRDAPPWEVTAHLYRHLLGRSGTAEELWRRDPGFRGSMELLAERGYQQLVESVVASPEFRGRDALVRLQELTASGVRESELRRALETRPR
jgi:hypothetical protein